MAKSIQKVLSGPNFTLSLHVEIRDDFERPVLISEKLLQPVSRLLGCKRHVYATQTKISSVFLFSYSSIQDKTS
jgi:hypothetical protein